MSRFTMICLPAMVFLAGCTDAPENGTTQSESEAVPIDGGAMTSPDTMSDTDGTTTGTMGSTGETGTGTMGETGDTMGTGTGTGTDTTTDTMGTGTTTDEGTTPPPS